jgi:ABC-2 type transport system permease protein
MFRTIWSKSLRDYRVAILGWGLGLALLMAAGFATATPAVLAGFVSLAPILSFLGDPYAMQTPEGYITFRYMGAILPLLLSFWPILAGARLVRGEEERGTMDVLLATPQPRVRLLLEKVGALLLALLLITVLFALGAVAGEARIEHHSDVVRALLAGLNVSLLAFFFGMVALLLSQVTDSRRVAAGWASGLLLLALLLYITGREVSGSWLQYLSPFYYYNLNRPFIPSFPDQPVAVLLLVGLSVLCAVGSTVLFARRDIGRPAFSWQRKSANGEHQALRSLSRAERALSTRTVSLHTLFAEGWSSLWWLLGIVLFSAYILLLTPSIQKPFYQIVQQTPWLAQLFFDTPTNTNTGLLGTIIFSFMPVLVVILALTLALKWSSDLENGRLELLFSTPQSRPRVQLERLGANVLVILLAPVLTWLALTIGAWLLNLSINQGRVLAASFTMLPPALITLGLVYALAGRLRYAAVLGIVTAYLVLAFLEETLEGVVPWPTWVGSLSIFHLYGNPIFQGMNWGNFLGMTGVAIVLLVISLVQFRSADIELG